MLVPEREQKINNHIKMSTVNILINIISAVLIVFGVNNKIFSISAFILNAGYFLFASPNAIYYSLFFLLPFANVFKLDPMASSLFTYLELVAVAKLFFITKTYKGKFLLLWMLFVLYALAGMGDNYTMLIKQAVVPLLIYFFFVHCKVDLKTFVLNFAFGFILSSTIAFFVEVPNISSYIEDVIVYEVSKDASRFSAFYSDPNYYTLNLILALIGLMVLFVKKYIGISAIFLTIAIAFFGMQTMSKSFLITFIIVLIFFLINLFQNKRYKYAFLFSFFFLIMALLVFSNRITVFENTIERLKYGYNAGDITTGRSDIWKDYIEYFKENTLKTIFGSGIGIKYLYSHVPHNTYIDFVYYYGIVGSILYISTIVSACQSTSIKRKFINYSPFLCLCILSLALSCLLFFDFAFSIIYVVLFLNYKFKEE